MHMRAMATIAVLLCSAASFITPAAALDGEVLISQSAAVNTGIGSGDSPGFPITITKAGTYKLTTALTTEDRGAFNVTANDVTIDLNGFPITFTTVVVEPDTARAAAATVYAGILATGGRHRLTVRNGTIRNFTGAAINNNGGIGSVVENMRITANGGVGVILGDVARLEDSQIYDNNSAGADLGSDSIVRNNTLTGNTKLTGALNLDCGTRCLVQGNVVSAAVKGSGIHTSDSSLVIGNVIVKNKLNGLSSDGGVNASTGFTHNVIEGNASNGVQTGGVLSVHPNLCRPNNQFCNAP